MSEMIDPEQQAVEALLWCDAILITAGAGMSLDSGQPDFRYLSRNIDD